MLKSLAAALVATLVAAVLVPFVRRAAHWLGAVDRPGGRRVHSGATARLGGLAILGGYLAAMGAVMAAHKFPWVGHSHQHILTFLGGGLLICAIGAFDDVRAIGAKRKLLGQMVVASIAWFGGARIESFDAPIVGHVTLPPALNFFLTLGWILAFINAINLIDGLDGLAGGVAFLAAVTNTVVAFISGNALASVTNASLGGAVLGFLFYNFNPATIFLGDAGSMLLGYLLGAGALLSGRQKESTIVSLLVPVIALGLPITDTLFAMVRRFLARRPIFSADRGHIHHRLLDLGLTHRRAVLILYGCSVLLCFASIAAAFGKDWQVGAALAGAVFTLVGVARFAGYFQVALMRQEQRAHLLSAPTDAVRRALPRFVLEASSASSVSAVWAAVERLLASGFFAYAEHVPGGEAQATWRWEPVDSGTRREGKLVVVDFRIRTFPSAPSSVLRFGCLSDESSAPPQLEVLLQIVADATEDALVRLHVEKPTSMLRAVPPESDIASAQ